jgi:hypothetical protein
MVQPAYRNWLESTPWCAGKPLPLGPPQLVLADALGLLALGAAAWRLGGMPPLGLLLMLWLFFAPYLILLAFALWLTGEAYVGFAVLAMVGLTVRLGLGPHAAIPPILLAGYGLAYLGYRRSLRRWPWPARSLFVYDLYRTGLKPNPDAPPSGRFGWPFERLAPQFPLAPASIPTREAILVPILVGWWVYASLALKPAAGPHTVSIVFMVASLGSLLRLLLYVPGYEPPVSFLGRIATNRLIIPSFDQVFVTPLVAFAMSLAVPFWLGGSGVPWEAGTSIALTVVLLVLFLGGPSRQRWWLTAQARMTPASPNSAAAKQEYVQVG